MQMTQCQTRALRILRKWYHGSNPVCILQGNAGTGKTTLVKQLLDTLPNVHPLILAPFNEAVKQLERSIGNKYPLKTVCSALAYTMQQQEDGLVLAKVGITDLSMYNLLIIDEASTLSEALLNEIENLQMYTLFIGHKSQLPPVVKDLSRYDKCISPAFTRDYLTIDLVETVRHTGELADFCNLAESLIYKAGVLPSKYLGTLKQVTNYLNTSEGNSKLFSGDLKFLAWTNEKVDFYNSLCREILFPDNKEFFLVDDRVILNRPAYGYTKTLQAYTTNITQIHKDYLLHTTNTKGVIIAIETKTILNVLCWELLVRTDSTVGMLSIFYVPMDNMEYEIVRAKYTRRIFTAKEADKAKHLARLQTFDCVFANMKHNYSMTVNKAQGSTIDITIVDEGDINRCENVHLKRKLKYVAFSRAKTTLIRLK